PIAAALLLGTRETHRLTLSVSTRTLPEAGAKNLPAEIVKVAFPDHLILADLPVAKGIGSATAASPVKTIGRRSRRQLGERVHFCVRCDFPIVIYGRLGPLAFYKGFSPNFGRLGSWNVIMFLTFEQGGCSGMSMDSESKENARPDVSIIEYNGFEIGPEAELAAIYSVIGEQPVHIRQMSILLRKNYIQSGL
ncbi:mitochondrial uncoupling protein 1-like, partial [Rosa rugosa]|uniref:mitochondrial uncoupling protein 1-like n=1 Tax=Rosa rugosa TaxID=74645 RepID=UPI002B4112BC